MDMNVKARAGADAGGTFTDFVALVEGSGELLVGKTLSTPADPASAIEDASQKAGLPVQAIDVLVYGTTVATNALLERKGAKVGLLATKGFRDLLAIQRVTRLDHFDLHWKKTPALVSRRLRRGVVERVLSVAGLTTGLILGLFLLGRFRRVPSAAAIGGLVCGAVVVGLAYLPSLDPVQEWLKANLPGAFPADKKTALAFPWYAPVGAGVTVGVALLLSPLSRNGPVPTPADGSPEPGVGPAG